MAPTKNMSWWAFLLVCCIGLVALVGNASFPAALVDQAGGDRAGANAMVSSARPAVLSSQILRTKSSLSKSPRSALYTTPVQPVRSLPRMGLDLDLDLEHVGSILSSESDGERSLLPSWIALSFVASVIGGLLYRFKTSKMSATTEVQVDGLSGFEYGTMENDEVTVGAGSRKERALFANTSYAVQNPRFAMLATTGKSKDANEEASSIPTPELEFEFEIDIAPATTSDTTSEGVPDAAPDTAPDATTEASSASGSPSETSTTPAPAPSDPTPTQEGNAARAAVDSSGATAQEEAAAKEETEEKFTGNLPKVLIAGGGIAGLITAAACRRKGMDVTVFEKVKLLFYWRFEG